VAAGPVGIGWEYYPEPWERRFLVVLSTARVLVPGGQLLNPAGEWHFWS
jgi:hypothetical protein